MTSRPQRMTDRPEANSPSSAPAPLADATSPALATPALASPFASPARATRTDVLSDVLSALRLRGAVFYAVSATSPWVAEAPAASVLAPHVMPGSEHVIEYHVVTSGSCFASLVGEPAVRLDAGDIVVFPHGDAHVMSSDEGMRGPIDVDQHARAALARLPVRVDLGGGTGRDPVAVVCGFLACDPRPFNPLLDALPRLLHLKRGVGTHGDMLDHFVNFALTESRNPRPGGDVVLARLSELMFVEVVRDYVAARATGESIPPSPNVERAGTDHDAIDPSAHAGWLSGLRDDVVGRALAALHAKPAHPWTIEELAREVGASRSALAERFHAFVKVPPMLYLTRWRMQLATAHLAGSATLATIAAEIGYGSEAAFSRAFKKVVGVAPNAWRERSRASG